MASYALSDAGSDVYDDQPTSRGPGADPDALGRAEAASTDEPDEESRGRRGFDHLLRPEAIEEVSEPVSPASGPPSQPHSAGTSVLTEMLRNSTPDELRASMDKSMRDAKGPVYQHAQGAPGLADEGEVALPADERTALLGPASGRKSRRSETHDAGDLEGQRRNLRRPWLPGRHLVPWLNKKSLAASARAIIRPSSWDVHAIWQIGVVRPASHAPAVVLGLLLNILDGLSYGGTHGIPYT